MMSRPPCRPTSTPSSASDFPIGPDDPTGSSGFILQRKRPGIMVPPDTVRFPLALMLLPRLHQPCHPYSGRSPETITVSGLRAWFRLWALPVAALPIGYDQACLSRLVTAWHAGTAWASPPRPAAAVPPEAANRGDAAVPVPETQALHAHWPQFPPPVGLPSPTPLR